MSTAATPSSTLQVAEKLADLRKRYSLATITIEVSRVCLVVLVAWLCIASLDFFLELSLGMRRFALLVSLACVVAYSVSRLRVSLAQSSPHYLANLLEGRFTGFGQRLRTILDAVQGRIAAPNEMLSALGNQALGRWDTVPTGEIIPAKSVGIAVSLFALVATCSGAFAYNDHTRTSLLRALSLNIPYTSLAVTPGNIQVLEGDDVALSLDMLGRRREVATLAYRFVGSASQDADESQEDQVQDSESAAPSWIEVDINYVSEDNADNGLDQPDIEDTTTPRPTSNYSTTTPARFETWLRKLAEPVEYRFVTSVGTTDTYRIDVRPLVSVDQFQLEVESPAYTGAGVREFSRTKIDVLQGSKVKATLTTSHPLKTVQLEIGPKADQLKPLDSLVASNGRRNWEFELPAEASLHWKFSGMSDDDVPVKPHTGRIRVRSDAPPRLKWRSPAGETKVSPLAEVDLQVDVSDDYGITESGIIFQLGDEEEFVLKDWSSDQQLASSSGDAPSPKRRLRLGEILPLESFGLGQFDYVSYYAYAIDNREGEAYRSESDLRFIDIRPLRQYFARREPGDGGPDGGGGGFRTSVDEIIRRQRRVINQTRRLSRTTEGRMEIAAQLGSVDAIVATQSELAGFVRFLIGRLQQRGFDDNLDALFAAESSMLLAADSLSVGQLALAQTQQREAMRSLVEANDELERLIGELSSRERQELRNAQRELERLLNLAPTESDQRLASELRVLANQQRELETQADSVESKLKALAKDDDNEQLRDEAANLLESVSLEQVKHQERLLEISDAISEDIAASELVVELFRSSMDSMDALIVHLRNSAMPEFRQLSSTTADTIEELAVLVESLAPRDATNRIAMLRDLADSLAEMQSERAKAFRSSTQMADDAESLDPDSDDLENLANDDAEEDAVESTSSDLRFRLATLKESLMQMDSVHDDGEGAQRVREMLEELGLLELLEDSESDLNSSDAIEELSAEQRERLAENADEKAEEFRRVAIEFESLYRELVAPQLEKLRELERLASETQRSMQEANSLSSDDVAALQQLAEELRALGMTSPAEMLADPSSVSSDQLKEVTKLLRARIQELVFLESGAEETSAVPQRYEELIDLYFRALSGEVR